MDKPNKTDNAEQPAETADTEGGLTAEKPRSRHRKTSIAHIATVRGSVYTGGKTAKDIKKQAEQSAITTDDAEIIEIPEPVELYETDCLREPEDSEDASPYDPLSAVCLNGRRSVEELMETGNLSDIDRLRGIVVCEERPLNKKREYANRLTELLGGTLHMLPPVRSGNDVWKMLFDEIPSVFVVSVSLPDIDAFALINTLRQSKLCRNARFFVCAPKMTKSLIGISRNEKIDGLLSFSAPVEQTAAAIIEKCLDYEKKRGKSDLEALEQAELPIEDVKYFLLHQANIRIIESVAKRLHQPMEKFPCNLQKCGNVSAASVPILLDNVHKHGMISGGDKIVLAGFGAGLTWGACAVEW